MLILSILQRNADYPSIQTNMADKGFSGSLKDDNQGQAEKAEQADKERLIQQARAEDEQEQRNADENERRLAQQKAEEEKACLEREKAEEEQRKKATENSTTRTESQAENQVSGSLKDNGQPEKHLQNNQSTHLQDNAVKSPEVSGSLNKLPTDHAHSTTKCDSDENCLTKSDDTQDLGQNARDLSFHDKGQPENQQTDKQDTQDTANQNKPQNEQEKPAKPHQATRQAENQSQENYHQNQDDNKENIAKSLQPPKYLQQPTAKSDNIQDILNRAVVKDTPNDEKLSEVQRTDDKKPFYTDNQGCYKTKITWRELYGVSEKNEDFSDVGIEQLVAGQNFITGVIDNLTLGLTPAIRNWLDISGNIDENSISYKVGDWGATGVQVATGVGAFKVGATKLTAKSLEKAAKAEKQRIARIDNNFNAENSNMYNHFKKADLSNWQYPPNDGFLAGYTNTNMKVGTKLDRYGKPDGSFLAYDGASFESRALPPGALGNPYHRYVVTKEFPAIEGKIAPAFGQKGGGIQIKPNIKETKEKVNVEYLENKGYLKEIK